MPRALAGAALAVVLVAAPGRATTLVPTPDGGTAVDPTRAEHPPVVDGVLDDVVWKTAPLDLPEWLTYNPVSGQKLAQRTEVRVAYDAGALYFAFHCLDSEPEKVRATLSRRDQLFSDDWVGLSLDAVGNRQQSYDLFVNPRGVQADILNTATAGENLSPDWVWESAGRTPRGAPPGSSRSSKAATSCSSSAGPRGASATAATWGRSARTRSSPRATTAWPGRTSP